MRRARPADLVQRIEAAAADAERFHQHHTDIILMDLQMPETNGLDAMVAICKEFPEAKIIILTTYERDVQGAMKLGARAYLLKTELDRELLKTIRAVQAREIEAG